MKRASRRFLYALQRALMPARSRLLAVLIPLSLAAAPATPSLETMFPRRADVFVDAPGVVRLPLPPEVLAAVQPALSDVRLLDASGREIPYVIDDGGGSEPFRAQTLAPEVLDVTREKHYPDERFGPIRYEESFTVVIPPDPVEGHWSIVLRPERREFVARVRVHDADGGLLVEAPLFKLESLPRGRDTAALPPAGNARDVRVTIDSQHDWLSPQLLLQSRPADSGPDELEVPLVLSKTSRERGVSVYELERPRGLVPGALRITTSTPWFDRKVEVWDEGAGRADSLLGSARIARVDADFVVAEERDIAIRDAGGDRLLVRIADGDSPPLGSVEIHAVVQRPALLFYAGSGSPAATLVFGGNRVRAPHYDLAAFALQPGELATGPRKMAQPLFDGSAGRARLGELRANPSWRETPSLGFAQRAGTEVDTRRFSHRRTLALRPSPEGLSRLRLVPEDAAVARPDLADLRVVDGKGLQWPYLLERDADRDWRDLPMPEPFRDGRRSVYTLVLPVTPLAPDQIEIDSPVEFFDRAVRVRAQDEQGAERITAGSRLYRRAEDPRPVVLPLAGSRVTALSIEVEDGDDAPLPLQVRVRVPLHDLYLVAPEGDYTLVLGDPSAEAPRYELAHVRGVVLAAPSATVDAGSLEPNPRFRPRSRFAGPEGLQAGVWAVLIAAICVLLALTVRLVRSEQPAAASSAAPPPSGAPPAAPGASVPDAPPAPPAPAPPSDAPPPPA